jgi:hypothetical protein
MQPARLILYHKQATSARTRFLRLAHGGICAFDPLPPRTRVTGAEDPPPGRVRQHPAMLIGRAEQILGLGRGGLELEAGFRLRAEAPGATIEVLLARFTGIDPPFAAAAAQGAAFIDLTQARGMTAVELQLLRLAYERILG